MGKGFENYVGVGERVAEFRSNNPKGRILTEVVELSFEKEAAVLKASILNEDGTTLGTGHATCVDIGEEKGLEKAESIAVGRALNFAGYYADSTTGGDSEEAEQAAPAPRTVAPPAVRRAAPVTAAKPVAAVRPATATPAAALTSTTSRINELRSQFGKTKAVAPAPVEAVTEEASEGETSEENYDFAQSEAEAETPAPKTSRLGSLRR